MKPTIKNGLKSIFALVLLLISFCMVCPAQETAAHKFMVTASANLFHSANAGYRQIYSPSVFMPEIKIAYLVYRNIAIWGSFSSLTKNGIIEEVDEKAHIGQTMLGLGLAYVHKLSTSLRLRGELGLASISFKEEALEETLKGSGLGWRIGVNLDYFIGKKVFLLLSTAYSQASDQVQTGKVELGGFQAGAGLGFVF